MNVKDVSRVWQRPHVVSAFFVAGSGCNVQLRRPSIKERILF